MEIPKPENLAEQVFSIGSNDQFQNAALAVFRFQYNGNAVYRQYCNLINRTPENVQEVFQIPFLPISFFKTQTIVTTQFEPAIVFESSGTTGKNTSRHFVKDTAIYCQSFKRAFKMFYGDVADYCILGLLPSYLERSSSSLIYMVNDLVTASGHPQSGFYLYDLEKLAATLMQLEAKGQKTLLIGVTYALLDFAEKFPMPLKYTTIMETGGMKGRKKELLRAEVHQHFKKAFALDSIHSEYGMTELLSQAYAPKDGRFFMPPWMEVLIREEDDPLSIAPKGRSGGINIIDLANIYSCAFIATEDLGKVYDDGSFEVQGRIDNSDIRGCSLLAI